MSNPDTPKVLRADTAITLMNIQSAIDKIHQENIGELDVTTRRADIAKRVGITYPYLCRIIKQYEDTFFKVDPDGNVTNLEYITEENFKAGESAKSLISGDAAEHLARIAGVMELMHDTFESRISQPQELVIPDRLLKALEGIVGSNSDKQTSVKKEKPIYAKMEQEIKDFCRENDKTIKEFWAKGRQMVADKVFKGKESNFTPDTMYVIYRVSKYYLDHYKD